MAKINSLENLLQTDLLDIIIPSDNKLLRFFNQMLLYNYSPDINGYTLLFMVPPDLSGLSFNQTDPRTGDFNYNSDSDSFIKMDGVRSSLNEVSKFVTFSAVDFTMPQEQLNVEKISSRSGAIPYATEFTTSEQLSVTYIDDSDLTIYKFHQIWMHYIWDVLEGKIRPSDAYLNSEKEYDTVNTAPSGNYQGGNYHGIDYAASFYVVKYKPDMNRITYIGKCIGVFPQSLPSKELVGQRTTNELTTLPFSYLCAAYRAEVVSEINISDVINNNLKNKKYWILTEFYKDILTKFT
jgi:hypothetical protein